MGIFHVPLNVRSRGQAPWLSNRRLSFILSLSRAGQIGVVLDVYDAVPDNAKEFHSHHVLLTNLTDRLLEELRAFPLEVVKGVFIENGLINGVIFEKIHRGKRIVMD